METRHIVIFDGICNFCNMLVNFIIKRDPENKFVFTPMQSDFAQSLIKKYRIQNVWKDSFLLIKGGRCYIWTDAAFEIAKDLRGYWYFACMLKIIPRVCRDFAYRAFARNRYNMFGKQASCIVPSQEFRSRFIGV